MRQIPRRAAWALALITVTFILPVSAFGQSGQSIQQQASQAATAQAAGGGKQLSVDEAVALALEQNLNLQVQRLDPQLQDLSILQVKTAWTPVVSSTFSNRSATSPVSSVLAGAVDSLTNDNLIANVQAGQLLPWGADYHLSWSSSRFKSNSVFDSPNPLLQSNVSASYTQPLLRNFRIDGTRQQLLISRKNREITDVQLQQTVLTTTRAVKNAYWDLVFAHENLKVQQQSLDVARESLKNNKSRVQIGTMAPIDIIEAEAEVARNEEAVIIAEATIMGAEDALRQLILDPKTPEFWSTRFELTDQPTFRDQAADVEAAVRNAIANRTDLVQMKKNMEATDVNIRYFRNQILPDLNLQAGYGLTGQGGTVYEFDDGFPPVPLSSTRTAYSSVLSRMFTNDYHNWSLAVSVGYPIGRSAAEAGLARAKVSYAQSQLQLRSMELAVTTQVRAVGRQLNTNRKRVDATRASRQLSERRLEAEQKKFAAGMSNNFQVIQAQRDLAQARNAELQAVLDYNRSVIDFEVVQQAPLSGGGTVGLASASTVPQVSSGNVPTGGSTGSNRQQE
ncbi:MAG: TolC family protein [Acidobacteria bacterium]|nr:MAG: TolC family protein [Acidobacteriota bacterium]